MHIYNSCYGQTMSELQIREQEMTDTTDHTDTAASSDGAEFTFWRNHTRLSRQPVAAPSVLGLFGFARPPSSCPPTSPIGTGR
jgi:hypothetical protein